MVVSGSSRGPSPAVAWPCCRRLWERAPGRWVASSDSLRSWWAWCCGRGAALLIES
ncbi:MAG: hypothetical protein JWN84_769 [Nocardioides sp.]|nr:hypothetical protein [Nocardioides sp.]